MKRLVRCLIGGLFLIAEASSAQIVECLAGTGNSAAVGGAQEATSVGKFGGSGEVLG